MLANETHQLRFSAVGGLETYVAHGVRGGLLVPPGDVEAWAGAIDRLVDEPLLARRLAVAGARQVAECRVEDHVTALDQLVAQARG